LRSFEEIKAELDSATLINDVTAMQALAQELRALETPKADATAMSTLGRVYWSTGDYPAALEHYRQAVGEFEAIGDRVGVAYARRDMGSVFWSTGDYSVALEQYQQALALLEELGDSRGAAHVSRNMGMVYRSSGDYAQALECYQRALKVHEELGDRTSAARANLGLGNLYSNIGDMPLALEHYRRALQLQEELGDQAGAAHSIGNLGIVYMATGDFPQAVEHYRRALRMHEEVNDRAGAANVTCNIGVVYMKTGDYPQALEHFQHARQLHEKIGNRPGAAIDIGNMGNVYKATGDLAQALEHYRRALQIHEDIGNRAIASNVTGNIASVLLKMNRDEEAAELLEHQSSMLMDHPGARAGYHSNKAILAEHEGDLDEAWDQLQQALAVVIETGERDQMAECHEKLRELAKVRNDFERYVEHNNEYMRITEEVKGREATQRLAMMDAERKIEGERREREKERALLYGALPETVANRMLQGEDVSGDHFDRASVLFLDIAGFTTMSAKIPPGQVVRLLKSIFKVCDDVCKQFGVTKIKTIGDSYMAVAGVPESLDDHAHRAAQAALHMIAALSQPLDAYLEDLPSGFPERLDIRIGLHCGPLVAGIVGDERLQYDVWGDTVNVASRMESTGEPGKIQVSSAFATALGNGESGMGNAAEARVIPSASEEPHSLFPIPYSLRERGAIEVKGKGTMTTYWLEGA